jgi:hypothetical protein
VRLRGQALSEFALAGPALVLLAVGLGLALLWAVRGAQADVAAFFGARALAAGGSPAAGLPVADPRLKSGLSGRPGAPRQVVGRLWVEAEGPQVLGVRVRELQAGQVALRVWEFFGGRPD